MYGFLSAQKISSRIDFIKRIGQSETVAARKRKPRKVNGGRYNSVSPNFVVGYVVPQKMVASNMAKIAFSFVKFLILSVIEKTILAFKLGKFTQSPVNNS